ncbi:MAG: hypothetical protein K0S02_1615 [Achromobacter mucicolens]|jgi:hypothetical protein|uniref:hypothetical protein n=1 Tax=Achromobacter mucicolens TaxID=1389922 RepID=UPI00242AA791|nr:hypothetical protein [Achromobacter mucicolens]MDF2861343.1 hypothetical protein [Achromobacter mucicolens]
MREAIKAFTGMLPRVEPHLLPAGASQDALNADLQRGSLVPFKEPVKVADLAKVGTKLAIYRFGRSIDDDARHWFHWLNDTDVARGAIPDDAQERTYFTEAGRPPRVTDSTMATTDNLMPSAWYRLGIPAPTSRATVTVTPKPNLPQGVERQSCLLAYTFVSAWGEEGPPNEVSEPFDAATGDSLNVINMEGPPAGEYNITLKRLYLSTTDATGTAILRFWREIPVGMPAFTDAVDFTMLGEALPERALVPPPADLFGLMDHPAGFMIGFAGKRVYRSEVFKPFGWPYYSPVADEIVGGAIMGQATVVCTKGDTYLATQADPITLTPVRLDGNQPCVAKRTIRAFRGGVVYASPDGLVMVDQTGGIALVTEELLTRDQWQAYRPESMHANVHDSRLFCWFDNGTSRGGLIFDLTRGAMSMTRTDVYATASFSDGRRDELFLALPDGDVHKWNGGALPLAMRCVSKKYLLERAQNIGAAQVVAAAYPVTFRLRAVIEAIGGAREVLVEHVVQSGRPFRLRGNYRARSYEFTVEATAAIMEVTVASTLGNVTAV